ncbi:hypothetical protein ACVGWR_04355, partial [Enterobacter hormaechei]
AVQGEGGRAGSVVAVSYGRGPCGYPAVKNKPFPLSLSPVMPKRPPGFFLKPPQNPIGLKHLTKKKINIPKKKLNFKKRCTPLN